MIYSYEPQRKDLGWQILNRKFIMFMCPTHDLKCNPCTENVSSIEENISMLMGMVLRFCHSFGYKKGQRISWTPSLLSLYLILLDLSIFKKEINVRIKDPCLL